MGLKPGSMEVRTFDIESFDIRNPLNQGLLKIKVEGHTLRFVVRPESERNERPVGSLTMLARLQPALEEVGWIWEWKERGIARRLDGNREIWLRLTSLGSGEIRCLMVEKGEPRAFTLPSPGVIPELPLAREDFPYLPPWPGSKISGSAVSQAPVGVKLLDGKEVLVMVNFMDKEYDLVDVPSAHEFLLAYRTALLKAGWEIDGSLKGVTTELQAIYTLKGRDIRATLRLAGDAMGISVADVGAQIPKPKQEKH